jgi:hypothetical protein
MGCSCHYDGEQGWGAAVISSLHCLREEVPSSDLLVLGGCKKRFLQTLMEASRRRESSWVLINPDRCPESVTCCPGKSMTMY